MRDAPTPTNAVVENAYLEKSIPPKTVKRKKKGLNVLFIGQKHQHYIIHKNVWICSYKHVSATCHYPLKYKNTRGIYSECDIVLAYIFILIHRMYMIMCCDDV